MNRKSKYPQYFFRMEGKLVKKLDRRILRLGYPSRGDFFTAVAYVALYGENTENLIRETEIAEPVHNLPKHLTEWLTSTTPALSEEQIRKELHTIIRDILFAVIAMKGVGIAFEHTWEDIRSALHDRTGIWATETEIREAYTSFEIINKTALDRYREEQLQRTDD